MVIIANWNHSIKELAASRDLASVQLDSAMANLALSAIFAGVSAMASVLLG